MLYYEDVEVGAKMQFGEYHVTRDEVIDFARKYDPQGFHLEDEAAAQTHFGRIAASGWHTCAMTMAMLVESHAIQPRAAMGGLGVDELRWLKPVYPGDTLSCEMELLEKRLSKSIPGAGILKSRLTTFNQAGEPVLSQQPVSLIQTRP